MPALPATAPSIARPPTLPTTNRFLPLSGPPKSDETTGSHPVFRAQGVYRPPHTRTSVEAVASATGSYPTESSKSTVRSGHGSEFDNEEEIITRPGTPRTSPSTTPPLLEALRRKIQEKRESMRKEEEERIKLEEEIARREKALLELQQTIQSARSARVTKEFPDWNINFPPGPSPAKAMGVNVGFCSGVFFRKETHSELDRPLRRIWRALTSAPLKTMHSGPSRTW